MSNSENSHAAGGAPPGDPAAQPPKPPEPPKASPVPPKPPANQPKASPTPPAPSPSPADPPEQAKEKTVVAKLRSLGHRGETVNTRWGDVTFDRDGLAELEVPESELPMLRDMRPFSWLAEDHTSYQQQRRQQRQKSGPQK